MYTEISMYRCQDVRKSGQSGMRKYTNILFVNKSSSSSFSILVFEHQCSGVLVPVIPVAMLLCDTILSTSALSTRSICNIWSS